MTAPVRLAKRLAELVSCSRREAELYIAGGWVRVDGQVVEEPQFMVSEQKVELHPEASLTPVEPVTILLHQPPDGHGRDVTYDETCHDRFPSPQSSGETTSHSTNGYGNCVTPDNKTCHDRFPLPGPLPQAGEGDKVSLREFHVKRVKAVQVAGYPASGREKQSLILAGMNASSAQQLIRADTRAADDHSRIHLLKQHLVRLTQSLPLERGAGGLSVFTQDWRVTRKLADDAATIEQEYIVEVAGELIPDGLKLLNHGMTFNGRVLSPVKVSWQNETRLRFALKGMQPGQIVHMCKNAGLQVLSMKRIRIGRVSMAKLQPGCWRYLLPYERF